MLDFDSDLLKIEINRYIATVYLHGAYGRNTMDSHFAVLN